MVPKNLLRLPVTRKRDGYSATRMFHVSAKGHIQSRVPTPTANSPSHHVRNSETSMTKKNCHDTYLDANINTSLKNY